MNRAYQEGRKLRRELGLRGHVDVESVANILRRWVVAHAIGHRLLHPGNHLWIRSKTGLGFHYEWEAEDFARGLLLDVDEAQEELLTGLGEVAEHFGVPEEMVVLQQPLRMK